MKEKFFFFIFIKTNLSIFPLMKDFTLGIIKHGIILCSTFKSMVHVQLICV